MPGQSRKINGSLPKFIDNEVISLVAKESLWLLFDATLRVPRT